MKTVKIGLGTCGISAGGEKVYQAFQDELKQRPGAFALKETGCVGMCYREVLVEVSNGDGSAHMYGEVTPDRVGRIVDEDVVNGTVIDEWLVSGEGREVGFFEKQERIVLRNCGHIDPGSVDEYIEQGGYQAARRALTEMKPDEIIAEIEKSGLRGRGGGGFPTGLKCKFTRHAPGDKKYIICNAEEGDPGAFMDRSILDG
ncbi:MAG: NADH-quinone oxidoreductase subunit F, partial [Candidatus Zixiibacteriota bacterium]